MKRFVYLTLAFLLVLTSFMPSSLAVEEYQLDNDIDVSAVVLADLDSGTILYSKNADSQVYPASTTKIMTIMLALENLNLDDTMTINEAATNYPSTQSLVGFKANEEVKVKDVIYSTMLASGNDGACALAIEVSGSTTEFANMMNEKALALGMTSTKFVNPHGVQNVEHYTTASDMLKLTRYAMQNETFRDIVSTSKYTIPATNKRSTSLTVENTNKLIVKQYADKDKQNEYYYEYATGIKTGSTPAAGGCLVASAEKDGTRLVALIYKDESSDGVDRWKLAKSLFDYGFSNYSTVNLTQLLSSSAITKLIDNGATENGQSNIATFAPAFTDDIYLTADIDTINAIKANPSSVTIDTQFNDDIAAPLTKGTKYGTATINYNGDTLSTIDLFAAADMEASVSGGASSVVTPQETINPDEIFNESNISPWWWLLFPGILIIILVIRIITVNKRKRLNVRRHVRPYHYRIK
ncbi:MAG: D-alanyl-D-alanine carboxypeptidase family protein [Eubacteriales bacterium]